MRDRCLYCAETETASRERPATVHLDLLSVECILPEEAEVLLTFLAPGIVPGLSPQTLEHHLAG